MMRVLWTTNIMLPGIAADLGREQIPYGGWLQTLLNALKATGRVKLGVAMRAREGEFRRFEDDGVVYYALPSSRWRRNDVSQGHCDYVLNDFRPDVLHAHGSELQFTSRFFASWDGAKILTVQGIVSAVARYVAGGGTVDPVGLADAMMLAGLHLKGRLLMPARARSERAIFAGADYVLGRTEWDRTHAALFNPSAPYFRCGEILRDTFSGTPWSLDVCDRHSILIGNGSVPWKGAHIAIKALAIVRRDYPDAKLKVVGPSPAPGPGGLLSYSSHLRRLLARLGLESSVGFLGVLDEEGMAQAMRSAHVFALSSLVENSPNTLGEAMALGVPCVAAQVGGVPSLGVPEVEVLSYNPADEVMLAMQIKRVFREQSLCEDLSRLGRRRSLLNHDPHRVLEELLRVYQLACEPYAVSKA